jgi:C-terminal processing protease CtpA/Prc
MWDMLAFRAKRAVSKEAAYPLKVAMVGVAAAALILGIAPKPTRAQTQAGPSCEVIGQSAEACELFQEVKGLLGKSIVPRETIERIWTEKNFSAALKNSSPIDATRKLLSQLGTSHTGIFSRDEVSYYDLIAITQYANGQPDAKVKVSLGPVNPAYIGIGAWFSAPEPGRGFTVTQVFPSSPAARAGLQIGDEILEADGRTFGPISSFKDKEGRSVQLRVRRQGRLLQVEANPVKIEPIAFYRDATATSVRAFDFGKHKIGYVRLYSFYHDADMAWLQGILTTGPLAHVDGLVLDLRGGWGATPIQFADPFVGGMPEIQIEGYAGYKRRSNWSFCKPVAGIIDDTTRSGKEIFAGVFKINKIPLIGGRTKGDVLSTRAVLVADGTATLELPLADVTLAGQRLEGVGVAPDHIAAHNLSEADLLTMAAGTLDFTKDITATRPICSRTSLAG